jgi:hypothetical protein
VPQRVELPGQPVRLRRTGDAGVRQLRHPDSDLHRGYVVVLVDVLGSGRLRAQHHAKLRRERLADVQQQLHVGLVRVQRGLHGVREHVRR